MKKVGEFLKFEGKGIPKLLTTAKEGDCVIHNIEYSFPEIRVPQRDINLNIITDREGNPVIEQLIPQKVKPLIMFSGNPEWKWGGTPQILGVNQELWVLDPGENPTEIMFLITYKPCTPTAYLT